MGLRFCTIEMLHVSCMKLTTTTPLTSSFEPLVCGEKECPYSNLCIAELAGYSSDQCSTPEDECPESTEDCSKEPSNPWACGPNRCPYATTCDAKGAGFDVDADCCQDTRTTTVCPTIEAPVSCGAPGGKQCSYASQCNADAAGYNEDQCCSAVPDATACPMIYAPVECGVAPCVYNSGCEAEAAGYTESECCATPAEGTACTMDYMPLTCGDNGCLYANECLAEASGYSSTGECCPMPEGACSSNLNPVACGPTFCSYDSQSCADLVFDSEECLPTLVVGDEQYVGYYDRACRADGSKGDFTVKEVDLDTCKETCTEDEKCKGYEYSDNAGKCEYHWVSGLPYLDEEEGAFSDSTDEGVQCFWKVSSANDITSFSANPTSAATGNRQTQVAAFVGLVLSQAILKLV